MPSVSSIRKANDECHRWCTCSAHEAHQQQSCHHRVIPLTGYDAVQDVVTFLSWAAGGAASCPAFQLCSLQSVLQQQR